MKYATEGLPMNQKLVHVTCVVPALHRASETVHVLYQTVNKLVANGKKVLLKSPARIFLPLDTTAQGELWPPEQSAFKAACLDSEQFSF
jgi:hypothetical protein